MKKKIFEGLRWGRFYDIVKNESIHNGNIGFKRQAQPSDYVNKYRASQGVCQGVFEKIFAAGKMGQWPTEMPRGRV